MTPDQLRTEAEMLARRSCQERQDYLYEVECCAHRGPAVAEQLQRMVFWIHEGPVKAPAHCPHESSQAID